MFRITVALIVSLIAAEAFSFRHIHPRRQLSVKPAVAGVDEQGSLEGEDYTVYLSRPLGMTVKKIQKGELFHVIVDRSTGAADKAGVIVGDQLISIGNMFGDGLLPVPRSNEAVIQWVEKQVRLADTPEIELQLRRLATPLMENSPQKKASEKEILELWRTAFKDDSVERPAAAADDQIDELPTSVFNSIHPEMLEEWARPMNREDEDE